MNRVLRKLAEDCWEEMRWYGAERGIAAIERVLNSAVKWERECCAVLAASDEMSTIVEGAVGDAMARRIRDRGGE